MDSKRLAEQMQREAVDYAKYEAAYDEWVASHPKACRTCGGRGAESHVENGAPHGEGFWAMPVTMECPDCLEQGRCPQCGADLDDSGKWLTCPACGWDDQTGTKVEDRAPEWIWDY